MMLYQCAWQPSLRVGRCELMACCELMAFCMAMKTFPATCRGDEELLFVSAWPRKKEKGGSKSKLRRFQQVTLKIVVKWSIFTTIKMKTRSKCKRSTWPPFFSHIRLVCFRDVAFKLHLQTTYIGEMGGFSKWTLGNAIQKIRWIWG